MVQENPFIRFNAFSGPYEPSYEALNADDQSDSHADFQSFLDAFCSYTFWGDGAHSGLTCAAINIINAIQLVTSHVTKKNNWLWRLVHLQEWLLRHGVPRLAPLSAILDVERRFGNNSSSALTALEEEWKSEILRIHKLKRRRLRVRGATLFIGHSPTINRSKRTSGGDQAWHCCPSRKNPSGKQPNDRCAECFGPPPLIGFDEAACMLRKRQVNKVVFGVCAYWRPPDNDCVIMWAPPGSATIFRSVGTHAVRLLPLGGKHKNIGRKPETVFWDSDVSSVFTDQIGDDVEKVDQYAL